MNLDTYDKRIKLLKSTYIEHTNIQRTIECIERCMKRSNVYQEPDNALIIGQSGTGKTTTSKIIESRYSRKIITENNCEKTIVPVINASIPSEATIKGVATMLLDALGDPAPSKGTSLDLTLRLGKMITMCKTQVIILDELQHLIKEDKYKRNLQITDWIKSLINRYKVPVIITGTPKCLSLIDSDKQISRRYSRRILLSNLEYGSTEQKGDFRYFIESLTEVFIRDIHFKSFPNFNTNHYSLIIYAITGGNPSDIVTLFKEASENAIVNNKTEVTLSDFQSIYDNPEIIKEKLNEVLTFAQTYSFR